MDEQAIFEALCRVHEGPRPAEGPEISLARFLKEAAKSPANDEDEFPDFAAEARRSPVPDAAPIGPGERVGEGGREALMQALLRTVSDYQGLLSRYNRDFDEVFARRARGEPEDDDETLRRLKEAQAVLVKYPVASQAAFAALVREGRSYAKTEEGKRYKRRLSRSPLLAKARTLFEGLARGIVTEHGGALPSTYVDGLLRALDRELEDVLADMGGVGEDL